MQRALSLVPEASRYRAMLPSCWMVERGDPEKAIGFFVEEPMGFLRLTGLAIAYDKLANRARAQAYLHELIATEGAAAYQYAQVSAQRGETEKALDKLENVWEIGDPGIQLLNLDRCMDPLRGEPRLVSLKIKWWDPLKR